MPEFLPMAPKTGANNKSLPSVSSITGQGMRISLVTLLIVAVVAFVVWKFVLKK